MVITPDPPNKSITIQFTDSEWSTIRHLNKVYGSNFFLNYLNKFMIQRAVQRVSQRKELLGDRFEQLSPAEKQNVLNLMGITIDDE